MTKLELVLFYFSLIENFSSEENLYKTVWHPEFLLLDLPNALNTKGDKLYFKEALGKMEQAAKNLNYQSYEILNSFETETHLVVEVYWKARFKNNHELKSFCCMVFEFQDELIFKQKNYSCYEREKTI